MRLQGWFLLLLLGSSTVSAGQDASGSAPPSRSVSKSDAKKAEQLFQRALRLQADGNTPAALTTAESSRELNPEQPAYASTAEFIRQQMVSKYLERGNQMMENDQRIEAMAEFRQALV